MPELPDLHVFALNLNKRLLRKNIIEAKVYNTRKIDAPQFFCDKLTGTAIEKIFRNGKEMFFSLANGNSFSVHLMLNGKFSITDSGGEEKISSKIMSLFFEGGDVFSAADFQGLCKVSLNPKIPAAPDALDAKFTFDYFAGIIKKNASKNIKAVLIDQKAVRGIGNAYVDEILWKADISPESTTGKIPDDYIKKLYEAIPFILNDAIENILRISPEIISGEERSFLKVHNPRKKATDEGDTIIVKDVAGKKTYFTDRQKLFV